MKGLLSKHTRVGLFALVCFLLPAPGLASPQAEQKQAQLSDLKNRIESLKEEVAQSEASQADVADQLRETERAISETGRQLRNLSDSRKAIEGDLTQLQTQSHQLQRQIDTQQKQLVTLLRRQYLAGEGDALSHFLSGQDPNQPARDAYYLRMLSQARLQWLTGLRTALQEKSRLAEAVKGKGSELTEIEDKIRAEQTELLAQQQKHQALLEKISARIKAQRREIHAMKQDEARLTRLVEGLARIVRRPVTASPPAENAREVGHPPPPGTRFAELKGRLSWPVRGNISHAFGSRRADGGSTWKGVFIRAAGGEVLAVAAGRVVFADWLRGFGNLLILDHGDEYLTVYGNNKTLFKSLGDQISAGEAIAAVGSSGGNAETGLYFELRFQGQALDPTKWAGRK